MSSTTSSSTSSLVVETTKVVLYACVAVYTGYQVYRAIPKWMTVCFEKDDFCGVGAVRGRKKKKKKDANDDIANPIVIAEKLRTLMKVIDNKMDDELLSWFQMYACFLSYVHLQSEICTTHPNYINNRYRREGEDILSTAVTTKNGNKDETELEIIYKHAIFAKWAYLNSFLELHENLRLKGHYNENSEHSERSEDGGDDDGNSNPSGGWELLRHDVDTEPGRVGHFIAVDYVRKVVIIAIKGTNTLSDALTDMLGQACDHTLPNPLLNMKDCKIRVHEGMYTATRMLYDDTKHLVEHFFLPNKFKIRIVGHSLGAGVASLLGLFLKSEFIKQPFAQQEDSIRVYAYATPACLDINTAKAMKSFTTTIVNNTDCVPRLSIVNLVTMNNLFIAIHDKLKSLGRAPSDSWSSTAAYVADLSKFDDDLLMSPQELLKLEAETMDKEIDEDSLFVPGRVVVMWEAGTGTGTGTGTGGSGCQSDSDGTSSATNNEKNDNSQEPNGSSTSSSVLDVRVGDGSLHVLRHIEISTNMITDHLMYVYLNKLEQLLKQQKSQQAQKNGK